MIGNPQTAMSGRTSTRLSRTRRVISPAIWLSGNNLVRITGLGHAARHAPDDAGGFVLHHDMAASPRMNSQPRNPSWPMPVMTTPNTAAAIDSRHASKKNIHRRSAGIFRRSLVQMQHRLVCLDAAFPCACRRERCKRGRVQWPGLRCLLDKVRRNERTTVRPAWR